MFRLALIIFPLIIAPVLIYPVRADSTITHDYTTNCSLLSIYNEINTGNGPAQGYQIGNCNSSALYAVAAGFITGGSSAEVKNKYVDTIYVPYYGQVSTKVHLVGTIHALGYVSVNGAVGLCCGFSAAADLKISLQGFGGGTSDLVTLQDWPQQCSGIVAASCGQWTTFDADYSFTYDFTVITSGPTYPSIALWADATASASATGLSGSQAQACGQYHSGDCANPPSAVNGGNPPQAASSTCNTGITSPCYYVQWKSSTYTLTDQWNAPADFSFTGPSSITMNSTDSKQSTLSLQSLNGYTGSITLSASGNPTTTTTDLNPPVVQLTESGSGSSILTLTTSGTPATTFTLTIMATTIYQGNSITHYLRISATVDPSSQPPIGGGGCGGRAPLMM